MVTAKARTGELTAATAGVILLISLSLPWYRSELVIADVELSERLSAWQALSVVDLLLCALALIAVSVPLARAGGVLPRGFRVEPLLVGAGALAVLLVLFRLVDLPLAGIDTEAGDSSEVGRGVGIFVALVAAAGIAYGGRRA